MNQQVPDAQPHVPVMLDEVMAALRPAPGEVIIDGTFGAGGYSRAILGAGARVIGLDRDPDAIRNGQSLVEISEGRLSLIETPFSALGDVVDGPVDGVVLDIGVSSMQIDQAERGFSFRFDGPLDMRMAQSGASAADVVNNEGHGRLALILKKLGEENHAGRIASMILRRREQRRFSTTLELADAIEALVGRKPGDRIHPATRSFQALRIYVNDELGELAEALDAAERVLKPGGRLVVVTFHSLEDRIVKRFMQDRAVETGGSRHLPQAASKALTFDAPLAKAVAASADESERNPRARSAKLRVAVRNTRPARADASIEDLLAGLPRLTQQMRG